MNEYEIDNDRLADVKEAGYIKAWSNKPSAIEPGCDTYTAKELKQAVEYGYRTAVKDMLIDMEKVAGDHTVPVENKFDTGNRVCYKYRPDVYIGTISRDSFIGHFNGYYDIFTSQAWFDTFAPHGGPNTLRVHQDDLALYTGEHDETREDRTPAEVF